MNQRDKKIKNQLRDNKKELNKNKKELRKLKVKNEVVFGRKQGIFDLGKKKTDILETVEFEKIYSNGICKVDEELYNRVIEFEDINYELESEERQYELFAKFNKLLNIFDENMDIQFFYSNEFNRNKEVLKSISMENRNDGNDYLRKEYRKLLRNQALKGNNSAKRRNYIIYGIKAKDYNRAIHRLETISIDILTQLASMRVKARVLDGVERYCVIHDIFNPNKDFIKTDELKKSKDFKNYILPNKFDFSNKEYIQINDGEYIGIKNIEISASELDDRFLTSLLDSDENIYVSMHIKPQDAEKALKFLKRKQTDIQSMTLDEQKKAFKNGYDYELIPEQYKEYSRGIKDILKSVNTENEKVYRASINIMVVAKTHEDLDNALTRVSSICNKNNNRLIELDYMQEQALTTMLPIGNNLLTQNKLYTTASLAIFIPFKTKEIFVNSKNSIYYGINQLSHNLIMADRSKLPSPNGLILGQTGSGKSFTAKREISNAYLNGEDDILICDPEGEYTPLVYELGGDVVEISSSSEYFINPLDINENYGDGNSAIKDKAEFIISIFDIIVGSRDLTAEEKSIIDECAYDIYQDYLDNPISENIPILEDLYKTLVNKKDPVAEKLAKELKIYVYGSFNIFNNRTNVDLNKRLLCFNIRGLKNQLQRLGMFIIQDQVWNKVSINRNKGAKTWYYMDEMHLLLKDKQCANFTVVMWKRFRKWGGIPTGLTQNIKDLMGTKDVENIFDNTHFVIMLSQSRKDREILADKLKISEEQLEFITDKPSGHGIIFHGGEIVAFEDEFPKNTVLYKKMTTKLEEVATS